MGSARRFDLSCFGCDIFFETGTGTGESLAYAIDLGIFSRLYSVEIHAGTAITAAKRFHNHKGVYILNSDSVSALNVCLPEIEQSENVLFFLDAHFPGEMSPDFGGYQKHEDMSIKLPLHEEISVIKHFRPDANDTIIIDDLRIYEDGPFQNGNMPAWAQTLDQSQRNIDFVYDAFPNREIVKLYNDEGYVIVVNGR